MIRESFSVSGKETMPSPTVISSSKVYIFTSVSQKSKEAALRATERAAAEPKEPKRGGRGS